MPNYSGGSEKSPEVHGEAGPSKFMFGFRHHEFDVTKRDPERVRFIAILDASVSMGGGRCGRGGVNVRRTDPDQYCLGRIVPHLFEKYGPFDLLTINSGGAPLQVIDSDEKAENAELLAGVTNIKSELEKLVSILETDHTLEKEALCNESAGSQPSYVILFVTDGVETEDGESKEYLEGLSEKQRALFENCSFFGVNIQRGSTDIVSMLAKLGCGSDFDAMDQHPIDQGTFKPNPMVDMNAFRNTLNQKLAATLNRMFMAHSGVIQPYPGSLTNNQSPFICTVSSKPGQFITFTTDTETEGIHPLTELCKGAEDVVALVNQLRTAKTFNRKDPNFLDNLSDLLADLLLLYTDMLRRQGLDEDSIKANGTYRQIQKVILYAPTALDSLSSAAQQDFLLGTGSVYASSASARVEARVLRFSAFKVPPILQLASTLTTMSEDDREELRQEISKILPGHLMQKYDRFLRKLDCFKPNTDFDPASFLRLLRESPKEGADEVKAKVDVALWERTALEISDIFLLAVNEWQGKQSPQALYRITRQVGKGAEVNASLWADIITLNRPANLPVTLEATAIQRVFMPNPLLSILYRTGALPLIGTNLFGEDPSISAYEDAGCYHGLTALAILADGKPNPNRDKEAMAWLYRMHLSNMRERMRELTIRFTDFRSGGAATIGHTLSTFHSSQNLMAALLSPQVMVYLTPENYRELWHYAKLWVYSEIEAEPGRKGLLLACYRAAIGFANRIYSASPEFDVSVANRLLVGVCRLYPDYKKPNGSSTQDPFKEVLTDHRLKLYADAHMDACEGNYTSKQPPLELPDGTPVTELGINESDYVDAGASSCNPQSGKPEKQKWPPSGELACIKAINAAQEFARSPALQRAMTAENTKHEEVMANSLTAILVETEKAQRASMGEDKHISREAIEHLAEDRQVIDVMRNTCQFGIGSLKPSPPRISFADIAAKNANRLLIVEARTALDTFPNKGRKAKLLEKLARKAGISVGNNVLADLMNDAERENHEHRYQTWRGEIIKKWEAGKIPVYGDFECCHDFRNLQGETLLRNTYLTCIRYGNGDGLSNISYTIEKSGIKYGNLLFHVWINPRTQKKSMRYAETLARWVWDLKRYSKKLDEEIGGKIVGLCNLSAEQQMIFLEYLEKLYSHSNKKPYTPDYKLVSFQLLQKVMERQLPGVTRKEIEAWCCPKAGFAEVFELLGNLVKTPSLQLRLRVAPPNQAGGHTEGGTAIEDGGGGGAAAPARLPAAKSQPELLATTTEQLFSKYNLDAGTPAAAAESPASLAAVSILAGGNGSSGHEDESDYTSDCGYCSDSSY